MAESKALVVRTLEEEAELTERARLKKERIAHRREAHLDHLKTFVASIKYDAAKITNLRKHMFKSDEELTALKLTPQQRRIIRQFEEPKKSTAFGVESAAKLVESEVRAQAETKRADINVENLTVVLPQKTSEGLPPAVVIDVEVNQK